MKDDPMNNIEIESDNDLINAFNPEVDDSDYDNRRIFVRYIRPDITAIIIYTKLFKTSEKILVHLVNIGSKGILIESTHKLPLKKNIIVELIFSNGKSFSMNSKIVYQLNNHQYGLKFNGINNKLGDYLVRSARKTVFK